jgi:hypothetical protein
MSEHSIAARPMPRLADHNATAASVRSTTVKHAINWSVGLILVALVASVLAGYWRSTNECDRKAAASSNPMKGFVILSIVPKAIRHFTCQS